MSQAANEGMTTTIMGIDCARQASKVGLARGVLGGGEARIEEVTRGSEVDSIVETLTEWAAHGQLTLLALDAPLGWPATMAAALRELRLETKETIPLAWEPPRAPWRPMEKILPLIRIRARRRTPTDAWSSSTSWKSGWHYPAGGRQCRQTPICWMRPYAFWQAWISCRVRLRDHLTDLTGMICEKRVGSG